MQPPILVKPIPAQIVNERASFGPFDLKEFIQSEDGSDVRFTAEIAGGASLPQGLICTGDGIITGIPGKDTHGNHQVIITAGNEAGHLQATLTLTIKENLAATGDYADDLKTKVWQALEDNLPIPDLHHLYDKPVTEMDVYWLLERWAVLTIWDAFNLDAASNKTLLHLEGVSEHYNVYDRGSCLVASPKDLFSHERTLEDALQTSRAMAREVYKRGWTIEFAGFEKMVRAAWVELQHLGDKHGRQLEILHFDPTFKELRIYNEESRELSYRNMRENQSR